MELRDCSLKKLLRKEQGARFLVVSLICLLFMGCFQIPFFSATVEAATNPVVKVRIETPEKTIWNGEVEVKGCTITDANGIEHVLHSPKAACALAAAANQGGFSYTFSDSGWGLYLTEIDGIESDSNNFWLYRVNYSSPPVGLADYDMSQGDELLISYGPWPDTPLLVTASSTQVEIGKHFTIRSSYYDGNQGNFVPVGDAEVHLGETILYTDQQGNLITSLDQPGTYSLYIEKDGYVRSDRLQIEVVAPPPSGVEVKVNITNLDQSIWQGSVTVDATEFVDTNGDSHTIDHPTVLGALVEVSKAVGFPVEIANSAYGFYVVSIDSISAQGWDGWSYTVNGKSPFVGMGEYDISAGDNIAIYYSVWPWRLEIDKTTLTVGEEAKFITYHYDSSTKQWQIFPGATIKIGDEEYQSDQEGAVKKSFYQQGDYEACIISGGWQNSPSVKITVLEKPSQKPPVGQEKLHQSAQKALDYLKSRQGEDGSIENAGVSAWCAIAFGSANAYPETIKKQGHSLTDYLKTYVPASSDKATDFARQILAVLASGEDPRNFGTDLIGGLKEFHREHQIGDKACINDDIFGVLALLAAGEDINQEIIDDGIRYIVNHQNTDGGFSYSTSGISDIDTTSAAIQALVLAKSRGFSGPLNLDVVLGDAKNFLKEAQNDDGGFPYNKQGMFTDSNCASTSWAIQALIALGEDISTWKTESGSTPYHFLLSLQKDDGSFSWTKEGPGQSLMTAYAVPALRGRFWPVILTRTSSWQDDQSTGDTSSQGSGSGDSGTTTQQDDPAKATEGILPYTGFNLLCLLSALVLVLAGLRLRLHGFR